ncbi:MAG: hypothetical protein AVDCRST_MAG19-3691 [uncultured Thermomicrobiales bacterium]|uniref:Uncharacterized protein n=1 Tax=uncultured Thermomicrobiales bacterium TaxID=1645740 RepID=A0A6J4VPG0_9BACT|nr:MAG: hypothetical protein AVDCRST_MAG19-3691 [uncultured Thermomicrobiales bacterium]
MGAGEVVVRLIREGAVDAELDLAVLGPVDGPGAEGVAVRFDVVAEEAGRVHPQGPVRCGGVAVVAGERSAVIERRIGGGELEALAVGEYAGVQGEAGEGGEVRPAPRSRRVGDAVRGPVVVVGGLVGAGRGLLGGRDRARRYVDRRRDGVGGGPAVLILSALLRGRSAASKNGKRRRSP